MTRFAMRFPATMLVLIVTGCSSIDVKTGKSPEMNLRNYHTFKFATEQDVDQLASANPEAKQRYENFSGSLTAVKNEALDNVIRSTLQTKMAEKGLKPATTGQPDLLIAYFAFTGSKTVTTNTAVGTSVSPYGGMYGAPYASTTVPVTHVYQEGTLLVVLFDAKTLKPVWRGTASGAVDEKQDKDYNRVAQGADKLIDEIA